jgi:LexA DNA binding domain
VPRGLGDNDVNQTVGTTADSGAAEASVALMRPPTPSPLFTPKQGQYLAFIYAYSRLMARPPAEADLQRHFKVSPPSVHQMLVTLERRGLIRRKPGVARSIELLVPPESLPVLDTGADRLRTARYHARSNCILAGLPRIG